MPTAMIENVIARRQYSGGEIDTTGERVQPTISGGAGTGEIELVEFADLESAELTDRVRDIGKLLTAVEADESQCWELLIDPTSPIEDLNELARRVSTVGADADRACQGIRRIFSHLKIKAFVQVYGHGIGANRPFQIEARIFINSVSTNRTLKLSSRLLASLCRIIDHAGAALVRLEMLKINHMFALNDPQIYGQEAMVRDFEQRWGALVFRIDSTIGALARRAAYSDTAALLDRFCRSALSKNVLEMVQYYTAALYTEGWVKEIADLKAYFAEDPIQFKQDEEDVSDPIPDVLLVDCELGEIFDKVYRYVIAAAWPVLSPVHQREVVVQQIKQVFHEELVDLMLFTPEMRHHQDNPVEILPVIGLDKVPGNANLRDYYLRVRSSGEIA